jgi:tetratricopeptide (TPR) repeat protein/cell division protein FtsN
MKICLSTLLLIIFSTCLYAGDPDVARLHLLQAEIHVQNGSLFAAVEEYRQAIAEGVEDAEVQQQLSILLYHQGFVDEAIEVMERAVEIDPDTDYLHHELGLLYFARSRWNDAFKHFLTSLKINPGQTDSHYYLSQLFKRQGDLVAARVFARSAKDLGHPAQELEQTFHLENFPNEKNVWLEESDKIYLRQILTDNRSQADAILTRIESGEVFELFARDNSYGVNRHRGGYAGGFSPRDLNSKIVSALTFMKNLSPAVIIELDAGVSIIQKMAPLDWLYIDSFALADQVEEKQAPVVINDKQEQVVESKKTTDAEVIEGGVTAAVATVINDSAAGVALGTQIDQALQREIRMDREPVVVPEIASPIPVAVPKKNKETTIVPAVKAEIIKEKKENRVEQVEKESTEKTALDTVESKPERIEKKQSPVISGQQPALFFKMPKRPPPSSKRFWVQAGAFREKWYAEKRLERLEKLGYDSYLHEETRNNTRWFIAVASAYGTYGEAHSAVSDLKIKGLEAFVLKKR